MSFIKTSAFGLATAIFVAACMITASRAETLDKSTCALEFDQCLKTCDDDYANEPARRAACVPGCSGKFAACDAGVAYDKAKPWLEDQAKKTKDFFDGLIEQYGTKDKAPSPQEKTKDNSI